MENFLTWSIAQVDTTSFTSPHKSQQCDDNNNNNNNNINNNNYDSYSKNKDSEDNALEIRLSAICAGILLLVTIFLTTVVYVSNMFNNAGLALWEGWGNPTTKTKREKARCWCDVIARALLAPKTEKVTPRESSNPVSCGENDVTDSRSSNSKVERSLIIRKQNDKLLTKKKYQELRIVIDFRDICIVNANREKGRVCWWADIDRDKLWTTTTASTTTTSMMMMMVGANHHNGQLSNACSLRYIQYTHLSLLQKVYDYLQQLLQIVGDGCTICGTDEQVIVKILMVKDAIDLWLRCQRDEMLDENESDEERDTKEAEDTKGSTDIDSLVAEGKKGSSMTLSSNSSSSSNKYAVCLNTLIVDRDGMLGAGRNRSKSQLLDAVQEGDGTRATT
ncbi:uncharacterized protein LOC118765894 [Octopus sinensis]|uniref:Uncharacterized protein LOC118765894 n=1 Tax=Octopus sinensis TaxID=2607531 RepID=A0A7E6F9X4_9MOLL|nr:uncharacterized protein LOC118765894 [Octopus sinensis]